jgi:hypothetical protein
MPKIPYVVKVTKRLFKKYFAVTLGTFRSLLALKKGEPESKSPFLRGI